MDHSEMVADMCRRISNIPYFDQSNKPEYWLSSAEAVSPDPVSVEVVLYTERNEYRIVGFLHDDGKPPYLGASVRARTPRAGETWRRGNDLPDGDYSDELWQRIFMSIVGYELVTIRRPLSKRSPFEELELGQAGAPHTFERPQFHIKETVDAIIEAGNISADTDGGYNFTAVYKDYDFDISRKDSEDSWYIQVNPFEGCYLYDGLWSGSSDKTIEEAVEEALKGAQILCYEQLSIVPHPDLGLDAAAGPSTT